MRSLLAISIGTGDGSRFASVAARILRSQSKSPGVRFGCVSLLIFELVMLGLERVQFQQEDVSIYENPPVPT